MLQNIEGHIAKMRKLKQVYEEHNQYGLSLSDDDDIQEITPSSMPPPSFIRKRKKGISIQGSQGKGKASSGIGASFMPRTTPGAQPTIKSVL